MTPYKSARRKRVKAIHAQEMRCVHCGKSKGEHSFPSSFCPFEIPIGDELFDGSRCYKAKQKDPQ
jgi:hypothetical protein